MAHVKLIQNDCFALGEELLHISDLVYQRGRICLALTAGVLQDVPGGMTAMLGNGFPPGGTKVEVTRGSAPDSSRLQHYLFMHVLCVPTVRYLHKCNFFGKDTTCIYSPQTVQNYNSSNTCSFCFALHHLVMSMQS